MKYFLSVLAIFKNEGHIINEWIEHYIDEGVEHFYLIDNGSDDNYLIFNLNNVDLVREPIQHNQVANYNNNYLIKAKRESKWVIVVDLDEFIYSRSGTISSFLKMIPDNIEQIVIPWKIFGSSGFIYQPNNVINNFVFRSKYEGIIHVKCIVRTQFLIKFDVHRAITINNQILNITNLTILNENSDMIYINELLLNNSPLHLNHYRIQSFEYFRKMKMERGDVYYNHNDKNIQFFNNTDNISNYTDFELSNKKQKINKFNKPNIWFIINKLFLQVYGCGKYIDVSNFKINRNKSFSEQFRIYIPNEKKYLIIRKDNKLSIYQDNI